MKKYLPFMMYTFISCIVGAVAFALLLVSAVSIAENGKAEGIVFFDSEGEVLELMGETLYLSGDTLEALREYPKRAADFALELMPVSIRRIAVYFSERIYSHTARLSEELYGKLYGFLSLGT